MTSPSPAPVAVNRYNAAFLADLLEATDAAAADIRSQLTPTATAEMMADTALRAAIHAMHLEAGRPPSIAWPYVERLCEIDGKLAWAVDDEAFATS